MIGYVAVSQLESGRTKTMRLIPALGAATLFAFASFAARTAGGSAEPHATTKNSDIMVIVFNAPPCVIEKRRNRS